MTPILPLKPNAALREQVAEAMTAGRTVEMLNEFALRVMRHRFQMERLMRLAVAIDEERVAIETIEDAIAREMAARDRPIVADGPLIARAFDQEPAVILDAAPTDLEPEFQLVVPSRIHPNLPAIATALKAGRTVTGARLAPSSRKGLSITYGEEPSSCRQDSLPTRSIRQ